MDDVVLGHVTDQRAQPIAVPLEVEPSNRTAPSAGTRTPASVSSSVVLPAPLPPMMATSWPGSMPEGHIVQRSGTVAELPAHPQASTRSA